MKKETQERYIEVHARMRYECEQCGKSFYMYLEAGVEDFENKALTHQPSPFVIRCPYCPGLARDVSSIQKAPVRSRLPEGHFYFARDNSDRTDACGIATHYRPIRARHG